MMIYLIRHGESTSDIKQKYDGDYNDHLTQQGEQEAEIIAKKILDNKIEVIFSSPKIRATETSKLISDKLGCSISIIKDLSEQDIYGAFLELGKNQPEEEYRRLGEIMVNRNTVVEGAETYKHFKERVVNTFNKIASSNYHTIAIITHGGIIRCVFRDLLNLGEFKKIGNGAIIELEKSKLGFRLVNIDGAILES